MKNPEYQRGSFNFTAGKVPRVSFSLRTMPTSTHFLVRAGITDNWEGYLQRMADPNVLLLSRGVSGAASNVAYPLATSGLRARLGPGEVEACMQPLWGGEPELVMAVNVIRRPITVHHIVDGAATPIVTYKRQHNCQHLRACIDAAMQALQAVSTLSELVPRQRAFLDDFGCSTYHAIH
eukprot:744067-Pelagomonas_calceolata.AAC.3